MIEIVDMFLSVDDWFGISNNIEIAKGKNKLPQNNHDVVKRFKRKMKWRLRKQ
jgi:hypothetical protein